MSETPVDLRQYTAPNGSGRVFRSPDRRDQQAEKRAPKQFRNGGQAHVGNLPLLPEGGINHLRGFFNVVLYGMSTWGDLFTPRQALSLCRIVQLINRIGIEIKDDFGIAVQTCLAMALDRCADKCASVVVWNIPGEKVEHVFGRQALPMVWDFAEANILSDIGWPGACEWVTKVVDHVIASNLPLGASSIASATASPLPDDSADAVITDPPYYAAIPYSDLSDFFYSWLKRSIGDIHSDLLKPPLTPKAEECVSLSHRAAMYREKDAAWFEGTMTKACEESRRATKPHGISVFVFANKETSGWEAMLASLVTSGWVITASWPIDTEMGTRLGHEFCRSCLLRPSRLPPPREPGRLACAEEVGEWRDVLHELPAPDSRVDASLGEQKASSVLTPSSPALARHWRSSLATTCRASGRETCRAP